MIKDIDRIKTALENGQGAESTSKSFGVLIPIIETPRGLSVLFEVRAASLRRQPGEICFPGGSTLDGESTTAAAIRETSEELLIEMSSIEVVKELDVINVYSGGILRPVVGLLRSLEGFDGADGIGVGDTDGGERRAFSADEVAEVFTVPLSFFLEHEPDYYDIEMRSFPTADFPYDKIPDGEDYHWDIGHRSVCFYTYRDKTIWGLTAGIMHDFVKRLKRGGYC